MKILALDISTVSTGWAIFSDGPTLVDYGLIPFSTDTLQKLRLVVFREVVKGLVKRAEPTMVVIEDTFVQFDPSVTKKLSRFAGVAIEAIASLVPTTEIAMLTTQSIRAALYPKQKIDKKAIRAAMMLRYSLPEDIKDDVTDAIASAHYPFIKTVDKKWIL
jgi:Holliday junction resolvasome RuvABC endonuclease subunit